MKTTDGRDITQPEMCSYCRMSTGGHESSCSLSTMAVVWAPEGAQPACTVRRYVIWRREGGQFIGESVENKTIAHDVAESVKRLRELSSYTTNSCCHLNAAGQHEADCPCREDIMLAEADLEWYNRQLQTINGTAGSITRPVIRVGKTGYVGSD